MCAQQKRKGAVKDQQTAARNILKHKNQVYKIITTSLILGLPLVAIKHFMPTAHFQWQPIQKILAAYRVYIDVFQYVVRIGPKLITFLHSQEFLSFAFVFIFVFVILCQKSEGRNVRAHTFLLLGLFLTLGAFLEAPILWLWMPHDGADSKTTWSLIQCFIVLSVVGLLFLSVATPLWLFLEIRGKPWYRNHDSGKLYPLNWSSPRGIVYTLESEDERFLEELKVLAWRRRQIKGNSIFIYGNFLVLGFTHNHNLTITFSYLMLAGIVYEFMLLFHEFCYRLGAQFILGAFVYDLKDEQGGRDTVEQQKAHGYLKIPNQNSAEAHLKRL